jgi:hypothetical protein
MCISRRKIHYSDKERKIMCTKQITQIPKISYSCFYVLLYICLLCMIIDLRFFSNHKPVLAFFLCAKKIKFSACLKYRFQTYMKNYIRSCFVYAVRLSDHLIDLGIKFFSTSLGLLYL